MYGNLKRGEDTEQMGVIDWANWNLQRFPELKMLYHVPNGGKRNPAEAARFKAMGVKAGVPDLCLPVPMNGYAGLYIEMKYGNNKPTAAQKEWIKNLKEYGYKVTVCHGGTEATAELEAYLQGSRTILTDPMNENCKPQKRVEIYCSSEDTENIRSALCAADEVIIPVRLDNWSIDGVDVITEQIEALKALNSNLKIAGILLTDYKKSIENEAAEEWLRKNCKYNVFSRRIRHSEKAVAATYYKQPLETYSPRSAAATDYRKFMEEYTGTKKA